MTLTDCEIKTFISDTINKLFSLYSEIDNSFLIDDKKINFKHEKVKRISFDNDVDFYFKFYTAISEYRERLKQNIATNRADFLRTEEKGELIVESRIKNINSISSKVYQYINIKQEKGDVPINKCLNDLFGMRIIVPTSRRKNLLKIIEDLKKENNWNCRITDASKQEYKAIHMYILKDNFSLRWEIQFWLKKDDKGNRESHAKYKQSYTSWESLYTGKELFRKCQKC